MGDFYKTLEEFRAAKANWHDKTLAAHKAQADFEFAEKSMTFVRERLVMEAWEDGDPAMYLDPGIINEIRPVEYIGLTLKQAAERALRLLGKATTEDLADEMARRGFRFTSAAPSREVHGALVKQRWASKNSQTKKWEYVAQ
ncbi:MAG TPA: hypothetical protein VMR52_05365 [Dehalococcoidia bacterium]|nr:hypothetical protein [Dehalococcoidia bacterium]